MTKQVEFTIDRAKWRAGSSGENAIGFGTTKLLNYDGYMCCLGHMCLQIGYYKNEIIDLAEPADLDGTILCNKTGRFEQDKLNVLLQKETEYTDEDVSIDLSKIKEKLCYVQNTEFADEAIEINDNETITNRERESQLRALAKAYDFRLKFVGKSKPNPKGV